MNTLHKQILEKIKKFELAPKKYGDRNYLGTKSEQYHLTNPQKWQIAKTWAKENKDINFKGFCDLLNSLSLGPLTKKKPLPG